MYSIHQTINRFQDDINRLLDTNLIEIILHGSYALDDFTPHKGDLDYTILTKRDLIDAEIAMLFELHDLYRNEKELLLYQLEGTTYPARVLCDVTTSFVGCYIGTGRKGWRKINTFQNSFIDLVVMKEKGIKLIGNTISFYSPSASELKNEAIDELGNFRLGIRNREIFGIGFCYSLIHWCARTIYFNKTKEITSKRDACRWCTENVERREFDPLFSVAENERYPYGNEIITDGLRSGCEELLDYTETSLPVCHSLKESR